MLPEVVDCASGKTNVKKAVKQAAATTVNKQLEGGSKRSRAKSKPAGTANISSKRKATNIRSQNKTKPARTKVQFLKNLHNWEWKQYPHFLRPLTTTVLIFL